MKTYVIGVLVSNDFEDMMKIKNTIYSAKNKLGVDKVEVCQITDNYRHYEVKKFIQEMGLYYTDVLRYDEQFNINSHDPNQYKFGNSFNGKYFHIRNSNFLSYCDGLFGFITRSMDKKDAVYQILKKAKDKKMNLKLFS